MWLHAGVSGEIPACGDVLTMDATRACSFHRRFLFCDAEVLANGNEETSRHTGELLRTFERSRFRRTRTEPPEPLCCES